MCNLPQLLPSQEDHQIQLHPDVSHNMVITTWNMNFESFEKSDKHGCALQARNQSLEA